MFGIEVISIDDNFFDLGGYLLKGMMFIVNIQVELEKIVLFKVLFEYLIVCQFVVYMEVLVVLGGYYVFKLVDKQDMYLLLFVQKWMYVLNQFDWQMISYNMLFVFLMEGEFDILCLCDLFNQFVNCYELLCILFMEVNGEFVQCIIEEVVIDFYLFEVKEDEVE